MRLLIRMRLIAPIQFIRLSAVLNYVRVLLLLFIKNALRSKELACRYPEAKAKLVLAAYWHDDIVESLHTVHGGC